jgi:hypothetical protein
MELTYTRHGDYLLPDLTLMEQSITGKYGILRKTFLKEHKPATYAALLLSGRLSEHLSETDYTARERVRLLTEQMAQAQGVTEALKASDPMEWTGRMNNIRACAKEVILAEVVFA